MLTRSVPLFLSVFGTLMLVSPAIADEKPDDILEQLQDDNAFDPVNLNADQFRDVTPSDWAWQALQDLQARYDCLQGYPDETFRGDRALTRYEFATGLNACWQSFERQLAALDNNIAIADLKTLDQLRNRFAAELETLSAATSALENRVAFLEEAQFSPTTKLQGEVVFALTDTFGASFSQTASSLTFLPGTRVDFDVSALNLPTATLNIDNNSELVFGATGYLDFVTSFSGRDRLFTRIATTNLMGVPANSRGNVTAPAAPPLLNRPLNARLIGNTGEGAQTFNLTDALVAYSFPVGNVEFFVSANRGTWNAFTPTNNPYFGDRDRGNGALSTLASENPIYRIGGGAGVGLNAFLNDDIQVTAGYLAGPGASNSRVGVFKAGYGMLGQVSAQMGDVGLGLTYVHGYHRAGEAIFGRGQGFPAAVGTALANFPGTIFQRFTNPILGLPDAPVVSNSYGVSLSWEASTDLVFNGFFAYTDNILVGQGGSEVWSYGVGVAAPDLFKENDVLGLFFGTQPYAGEIRIPTVTYTNNAVPYQFEAFYRFPLHERISLTPGLIWLFAANEFDNDVVLATLRTTFSF